MVKSDVSYIVQMHANIEKIEHFTVDYDFNSFIEDEKTQSAVLMQLLLTGELAKRVSDSTKDEIDTAWPSIMGFRNVIVHEYYEVSLPVVWNILKENLSDTKEALRRYINLHPQIS